MKQELSYTAWGLLRNAATQTAYTPGNEPALFLGRGYTGHEHLAWFGLINMNARLYDPALGRFLSPDPYVQMPDFTQNFNRYSYCLNNPLVYVDKDGEWVHLLIGALIGGAINWATHGFQFTWKGLGYFGIGALSGALAAGIGAGISSVVAGGGFSAGFMGTAAAKFATTSFISGAAIGGGSGGASGFINGIGNSLIEGKNLGNALVDGLKFGGLGVLSGAAIGGLFGGLDALFHGRRFFDGATVRKEVYAEAKVVSVKQEGNNNCLPASGESVDKSLGGNVTQQDLRNVAGGNADTDPLQVGKFWKETFSNTTGKKVEIGDLTDVVTTLKNGGSVAAGLPGSGGVGHSVVIQKVFLQTIIKVNGTATSNVMYRVMDPAIGRFRNVSYKDLMYGIIKIFKP